MSRMVAICGSFLRVEEETMTVYFAHHSVKHYFLTLLANMNSSDHRIDIQQASLELGQICVTYLNLDIFETQLTRLRETQTTQHLVDPLAILKSGLPSNTIANKLVSRLAKFRTVSGHNTIHQLEKVGHKSKQNHRENHTFLAYAQSFWLEHTKLLNHSHGEVFHLWRQLLDGTRKTIGPASFPWSPEDWMALKHGFLDWAIRNRHETLLLCIVGVLQKRNQGTNADSVAQYLARSKLQLPVTFVNALVPYAVGKDNLELAVALINAPGADLNLIDREGETPLYKACYAGHSRAVELLASKGVDVNVQCGYHGNALQAACCHDDVQMVQKLLSHGAEVNAQGGEYGNALQAAAEFGSLEVVQLLLLNGAEVNARGGVYGTALQAAAHAGSFEVAELLLSKGAAVNTQGGKYGNALQAAVARNRYKMVLLLLNNRANISARGRWEDAIVAAKSIDDNEILVVLLDVLESRLRTAREDGNLHQLIRRAPPLSAYFSPSDG